MAERYNDSPEAAESASKALLMRGQEILVRWRDGSYPLAEAIWNNLGFHVATVRLTDAGAKPPIGKDATTYIALILAAVEHVHAQELLESALGEPHA
jgi:hypothetical protein